MCPQHPVRLSREYRFRRGTAYARRINDLQAVTLAIPYADALGAFADAYAVDDGSFAKVDGGISAPSLWLRVAR